MRSELTILGLAPEADFIPSVGQIADILLVIFWRKILGCIVDCFSLEIKGVLVIIFDEVAGEWSFSRISRLLQA